MSSEDEPDWGGCWEQVHISVNDNEITNYQSLWAAEGKFTSWKAYNWKEEELKVNDLSARALKVTKKDGTKKVE